MKESHRRGHGPDGTAS